MAHIDEINQLAVTKPLDVWLDQDQSCFITIVGWAIPTRSEEAFGSVSVRLVGQKDSVAARAKLVVRSDVADHFRQKSLERSGIEWKCSTDLLTAGTYTIQIVGTDERGIDHSVSLGTISLR